MRKENVLETLRAPTIQEMTAYALDKAGISYTDFAQKNQAVMSVLEQAGLGQYFSPGKISYEGRIISLSKRINLLTRDQFLVIGHDAAVLPTEIARYIRKSNALRIPYEFPETVNQKNLYANTVPAKLAELEKLVEAKDQIVGIRYDSNQGIRHHVFLRTHLVEADLLAKIDDVEVRVHDYVLNKETNHGTFWTIEGIPSLEKEDDHKVILRNVGMFREINADILRGANNLSCNHTCDAIEYYMAKLRRKTVGIGSDGKRNPGVTYNEEQLMCRHIITAYFLLEKMAPKLGVKIVPLFPHPRYDERRFYEKCRKQVMVETDDGKGHLRHKPLGRWQIEKLLWDRIITENVGR